MPPAHPQRFPPFIQCVAKLSLRTVHRLGALVGSMVYAASPTYRRRMRENLEASGVCEDDCSDLIRQARAETGKAILELPHIWRGGGAQAQQYVREVTGWDHISQSLALGRGLIFITPHLGCFEVAGLYYAAQKPITLLFRPPRLSGVERWLNAGRTQAGAKLAATDAAGVKALLQALRRNEAVGILPDQVPPQGHGVWAPFFGRPAYTMTLIARLQRKTGAAILMACVPRLPKGAGYKLEITPVPPLPQDDEAAALALNAAIETAVRRYPAQYLWSYNRYKQPRPALAREAPQ